MFSQPSPGPRSSDAADKEKGAKVIEIGGQRDVRSVAFLADGKHFVAGGSEGKLRFWRVKDGMEVGMPMITGDLVNAIAVSRNGPWIVSGANWGKTAMVWDVRTQEMVGKLEGHTDKVLAVDVSPDGTKFVTGSDDKTARIWSYNAGNLKELARLEHDYSVTAAKFSRDGEFFATATWNRESLRIYRTTTSHQGRPLIEFRINVHGSCDSIAWGRTSRHLFALSNHCDIHHLDISAGTTLSRWQVHSDHQPGCIALPSNDAYIAAVADSSLSFWDTATHQQIGSSIKYTHGVMCMGISSTHDMVTSERRAITIRNLREILPSRYIDGPTAREREISESLKKTEKDLAELQVRYSAKSREFENSNVKIAHFEDTIQQLRLELATSKDKADDLSQILQAHEQKHRCETLYAQGRINEATQLLLESSSSATNATKSNVIIMDWRSDFSHKCLTALEGQGDELVKINNYGGALTAYTTALSLNRSTSTPNSLLLKWAKSVSLHSSVDKAVADARMFHLPMFDIFQAICDVLEEEGRIGDAIEYHKQMQRKLADDTSRQEEKAQWELDFLRRCKVRLEGLAAAAMEAKKYHEAAEYYSNILSLNPSDCVDPLINRSHARVLMGSWEDALRDANEVIQLEPSSPRGYEKKHIALHAGKRHTEAVDAFHVMLSKLAESPHHHIHELHTQYIDVSPEIQKVIEKTVSYMPRVLIDTTTGRLYDKAQQTAAFKNLPIYDELRSSMTTRRSFDFSRIQSEVKRYYRYVMLSHRWDYGEPLFQTVQNISVYDLEPSSTNKKLQTFCEVTRNLGFHSAWSDTCCIDKRDIVVLHESLVAMFTWYRGSTLTLVYLRKVWSRFQKSGDLRESEWNERGWTYQEYVAAEAVQFYTEDWQPYLGLDMFNHKDSAIVVAEMEQASHVSAEELATIQPGFTRVREKLFMASERHTTLAEDSAYSLLGIFNANIFIRYGEGRCTAVGRLLEHVLTSSGDVTILAWTGSTGDYNSCLPPELAVYNQLVPLHNPRPIDTTTMNEIVAGLRSSFLHSDLALVAQLYHQLNRLSLPSVNAGRLQLPGLAFPVTQLVESATDNDTRVYHATTSGLGEVEAKTKDNLSGLNRLVLFHPWICTLLDQDFSGANSTPRWLDDTTRALRLFARLRQPFGALLLTQVARMHYRRVATDSLIMVQIREDAVLTDLVNGISIVDVQ